MIYDCTDIEKRRHLLPATRTVQEYSYAKSVQKGTVFIKLYYMRSFGMKCLHNKVIQHTGNINKSHSGGRKTVTEQSRMHEWTSLTRLSSLNR